MTEEIQEPIKKVQYPEWFNNFWKSCNDARTRSLGSKYEAFGAYNSVIPRLKPQDTAFLVGCFVKQALNIREIRSNGGWIENHPDLSRWLRRRYWENEISQPEPTDVIPRSDQRKAAAARRYFEEDMGESVEPLRSRQASLGRIGLIDIGLLEESS